MCMYVCVYTLWVFRSYVSVWRVLCVYVCTRVNICVLRDNDFSGITLLIKQLIALYYLSLNDDFNAVSDVDSSRF